VTLTGDSAGATASLATLADGSKSVSIGWPTKLPEPVLDGDTALYANVLLDVDLKIRANAAGRYFKRTRSFLRNGRRKRCIQQGGNARRSWTGLQGLLGSRDVWAQLRHRPEHR
jgi:hypothetical protein